jgi:hypothetical protein
VNRVSPFTAYALPITLLACAGILACTLTYPLNNDNALYAYMGDLLLKGRLPYIGSWDQNFPAIVGVHAVQILIIGHSQLAFHIFDIVIQLIGSYFLFRIGSQLYDVRAGMLAAVLASLYYVQQGFWMAGERDTYVTVLLLASFYLALRKERAFLVGVLAGLTFLFRPTYGLYPLIFFLWHCFEGQRKTAILSNIAGSILPTVLLIIIYVLAGGLREFWDATILFNFKIYSGEGASFSFWEPVRFYAISVIAVGIGAWYVWKQNRSGLILWAILLAASLLSLILLYRHSVYHYHPAMTLFILMSAIGWMKLTDLLAAKLNILKFELPIIIVLFFVLQTFRGNTIAHVLSDVAGGRIHSLEESYDRYEPSPMFGVRVQEAVGDYLKVHTHPNDTVQMFGPYSYPQYRAGLLTASRFQTLHAITMRGRGDTLQQFQKDWRIEYLNVMRMNYPIYFIVCDAPEAFRQYYGGRLGHEILHEDFLELGSWLDSNYYPETKIGAFTLYRRRG